MRAEYLAFDAFVMGGPLLLGLFAARVQRSFVRRALLAATFVAIPFLVWDVAVAGDHWWFEPQRILGWSFLGLPLEEYLFFLAVPYACLFFWEFVLWSGSVTPDFPRGRSVAWLAGALISLAGVLVGAPYTVLVGIAVAAAVAFDDAMGTELFRQRRFWWFLGCVAVLNGIFDGYLTARPVVHYSADAISGVRLGTIPIEDFAYATALVGGTSVAYAWLMQRQPGRSWAARAIERRFGGYRHVLRRPDPSLPAKLNRPRRVAVIGGGLAGLSAASVLASRGFSVTLFERDQRLGGKLAGWRETLTDGFETDVEHGFHAFFRHYYNLSRWLRELGLDAKLRPIGDYCVLARDGEAVRFSGKPSAPGLNLLQLARDGVYSLSEVALGPAGRAMDPFLRYGQEETFAAHDDESFAEFSARAKLPSSLQLVFRTFARAFFATDEKLSLAELIKSFHFYYLSHDRGLGYDFLGGTYREDFIGPIESHLRSLDVDIRLGTSVDGIERSGDGLRVAELEFDQVVLATDVGASKSILSRSADVLAEDPVLARGVETMGAGQPYVVWRLWLDAPGPDDVPVFVATERAPLLDAVAFNDRIDDASAAWANSHEGSVLELHCYAIAGAPSDEEIRASMLVELRHHFACYANASVVHQHFQRREDFTALHTGMWEDRPQTQTAVRGLHLAGDWVKLPCPAMLMEAAHVSALLCADAICAEEKIQGVLIETVPERGLLAPARAKA